MTNGRTTDARTDRKKNNAALTHLYLEESVVASLVEFRTVV